MTKDIKQAVLIEDDYQANKQGRSLSTLLEAAGYTSLDEYIADKKIYCIKNNPFVIADYSFINNVIPATNLMYSGEDKNYFIINNDVQPFIITASDTTKIAEYEALNLPVIETWLTGRSLLVNTNDFAILVSLSRQQCWYDRVDLINFIFGWIKRNCFTEDDVLSIEEGGYLVANDNQVFGTFLYEPIDGRCTWIIQLNTDNGGEVRNNLLPLEDGLEYYELSCKNEDIRQAVYDWGNS